MELKENIINLLKNNAQPMKAGEIAEGLGVDKKDVDKAIKILKTEGSIDSPKRCYYAAN